MKALVLGGSGFIGLNIASAMLAQGHDVTVFDARPPAPRALAHLSALPGRLGVIAGDVMDRAAIASAMAGAEILILGAAITAGPEREASDPAAIITVNLLSQVHALEAARDAGVRRVINLSSAAAYGRSGLAVPLLEEDTPCDPSALYGITKRTSERIGTRLGELWGIDLVSARLSGVFGPWEHDSGVRDTPSPQFQVMAELLAGRPALLPRPGLRDWTYAVDIAEAILALATAPRLERPVYNITAARLVSVLDWGQAMAAHLGSGMCRLAQPGERPTIDMHGGADRAPMSAAAMEADTGWRARFDLETAAADFALWQAGK